MTLKCQDCDCVFKPKTVSDEDIRFYGPDWDFSDDSSCPRCGSDQVTPA